MIQKEHNNGFAPMHKINQEQLRKKNLVCRWVLFSVFFLSRSKCWRTHVSVCNASSLTARLTVEFLEQKRIKVIKHLLFVMWDFWRFHNLKKNLRSRWFHSEVKLMML